MSLHIMEIMNELKGDKDRDVSDAAENSDYKMLHAKKKTKEEEKQLLLKDSIFIEQEN